MEVRKSQNILLHGMEIYSRPKKSWHMSMKEKDLVKQRAHVAEVCWSSSCKILAKILNVAP